jgi:hypothetical protein
MQCPSCQLPMSTRTLDAQFGRAVEIDRCDACHVFWFDQRESLQLSPRATLELFRLIGEATGQPRTPLSAVLRCPRCSSQLRLTHDRQRNVAFQYLRCPHDHGRLTTDFDFLREKNVVRPLSAEQLADLRRNVQFVNCSNCGAPVDLATQSVCAHCASPLSIVDIQQAGAVIAQLRQADASAAQVDPTLPLRLAESRREVDRAFAALGQERALDASGLGADLLTAGLNALARWLKD